MLYCVYKFLCRTACFTSENGLHVTFVSKAFSSAEVPVVILVVFEDAVGVGYCVERRILRARMGFLVTFASNAFSRTAVSEKSWR